MEILLLEVVLLGNNFILYIHTMFNKNKKNAFTLIEVVIVIFIIGLLATALIPKILSAQGRTRDSKRKADIYTISNALETYYLDKSKYPHSFSGIYI